MAPILKEADSLMTAAATTATAPSAPAAKTPNETPARPQPVPLEIPVTVNGARTVEGSDKREPFAESTQTVLVFPHGAVIRIATPLAPGQLVFLTNEKTKKEVVCQVVKSKSGGSASGYVELQFTEPAPAFWGLRSPGTGLAPAVSAVPRPTATAPAPKAILPTPVAPKVTSPAPFLAAPPAQVPTPPKPTAVPPVSQVGSLMNPVTPVPPQSTAPVAPLAPASVVTAPLAQKVLESSPQQTASSVEKTAGSPFVSVPPPPPVSSPSSLMPQPAKPLPAASSEGPRDYSKEIESLFAVTQAPPATPAEPAVAVVPGPLPVASTPSTEELKQQAAHLQKQLSAMLFAEVPPAPPKPSVNPLEAKPVVGKIFEITQERPKQVVEAAKVDVAPEPKPENKLDAKSAAPVRTPAFSSFSPRDEEVEIPSWLRPLSQNSETVSEPPAASAETAEPLSPDSRTAAATEPETADLPARAEAAVFAGQLLSGVPTEEPAAESGSKKGLLLALAAAVVMLAGGGAWYYRQIHPATATPAAKPSSMAPAAAVSVSEPPAATNSSPPSPTPASVAVSHPPVNNPAPANSTVNPAPTRTSSPAASAPVAAPAEPRRNTESHNPTPVEEAAKKPALGQVHLAAPVVRGSAQGSTSGEPLPSFDAPAENSAADALAAVAHRKAPSAPIPVGGDVKPAQLIKSIPPVYPQMARTQRIAGNVTLDALIDTSGNVAQVKVISGPPLLYQAALDAVRQWKYSAAQLDGTPTAMHLTVTVQFRTQ